MSVGGQGARRMRRQAVAMIAYAQDEDHRRTREAGFDHQLVKPLDLEGLRDLLAGGPV
jgi:CheY-like chemotaxis protein